MTVDLEFKEMLDEQNHTLRKALKVGLRKEQNAQVLINEGRDYYEEAKQLREMVDEIEAKIEANRQDRKDAKSGRLTRTQYDARDPRDLDPPAEELAYDIPVPDPKTLWRAELREHLRLNA